MLFYKNEVEELSLIDESSYLDEILLEAETSWSVILESTFILNEGIADGIKKFWTMIIEWVKKITSGITNYFRKLLNDSSDSDGPTKEMKRARENVEEKTREIEKKIKEADRKLKEKSKSVDENQERKRLDAVRVKLKERTKAIEDIGSGKKVITVKVFCNDKVADLSFSKTLQEFLSTVKKEISTPITESNLSEQTRKINEVEKLITSSTGKDSFELKTLGKPSLREISSKQALNILTMVNKDKKFLITMEKSLRENLKDAEKRAQKNLRSKNDDKVQKEIIALYKKRVTITIKTFTLAMNMYRKARSQGNQILKNALKVATE